jgi:HEAT repeat protein
LIDIIKGQRDYRIRQLAARLLSELGPEAVRRLKHEILFEVTVVQRTRILEVIDSVTSDVKDELTYCLGDPDPKLRRAAFQLADRLRDESLVEVLAPFARSEDLAVAKGAISSMAKFRGESAVAALVSVLSSAKQPEVAIACCQALAQIGDGSCLEALVSVLGQKKRQLFGGRGWGEQVRATAALALGQISHPRAARILAEYVDDSDPRVSQLARSALSRLRGEASGRRDRKTKEDAAKAGIPDPTEEPA